MTLRDLGARGRGALHKMNAYFYDGWADRQAGLSAGDELRITGPMALLVRKDPSAASGDHPFCLAFHDEADDAGEAAGDDAITVQKVVGASVRRALGVTRRGGEAWPSWSEKAKGTEDCRMWYYRRTTYRFTAFTVYFKYLLSKTGCT